MAVQIPCYEWLNGSRTYCDNGHLCETCGEIVLLRKQLTSLVCAAECFTSSEVVDETSGTIPLMDRLRRCIEEAKVALS